MAKARTLPGQVIKLTDTWPQQVSKAGFELVEGLNASRGREELFLVEQPGSRREVRIPHDLYAKFWNLKTPPPTGNRQDIIRFANRFGYLRHGIEHFHRKSDLLPLQGESLYYWVRQIECFRDAIDLWNSIADGSRCSQPEAGFASRSVPRAAEHEKFCLMAEPSEQYQQYRAESPATYLSFAPSAWITPDPIEYAKATVVETINRALGEHWHQHPPCRVPGCTDPHPQSDEDAFNITRGQLRRTRRGINLVDCFTVAL